MKQKTNNSYQCRNCMIVTAWNNGQYHSSGAGYGLKISIADRDRYFKKYWKSVILHLGQSKETEVNIDKPSFWGDQCRELVSKEIGMWLIHNNKARWSYGEPPKIKLEPLTENQFTVSLSP